MKNVMCMSVEEMLDELATLREQIHAMETGMETLINEKIPEEIRREIADIRTEFQGKILVAGARGKALEDEIRAQCKVFNETRRGAVLQATFEEVHGWDTDKLKTFAVKHPEVAICQKITKRVTIENVKAKNDKGKQEDKNNGKKPE